MEQLLKTILKQIEEKPFSYQTYFDLYGMSKEAMKDEKTQQLGIDYLKTLSSLCEKAIRDTKLSDDDVRDIFALHKRVCLALAPYDFDSYLLYVEWNRPPDKKFYPPRRRVLKQVVDCLQELADDKLDLLSIQMDLDGNGHYVRLSVAGLGRNRVGTGKSPPLFGVGVGR